MAGPLQGVRVLDFTWVIAGPFATRILLELGAEIIKVEQPGTGDFFRAGDLAGNRPGWAYWNYGKQSISLNLKEPRGVAIARRLAEQCDVLVEAFRFGTLERLGLGPEVLRRLNPRLVFCSLSGFGATSSIAHRPLHAPIAHAISGIMALTGRNGDPPFHPPGTLGDPNAGLHLAIAICAALFDRERTGKGRTIDLALFDTLVWLMGPLAERHSLGEQLDWEHRPGLARRDTVPVACLPARDGWLQVAGGVDEANWQKMALAIGRADLADKPHAWRYENQDEVYQILGDWVAGQPSVLAAEAVLQGAGVLCAKVNNPEEMLELPTVRDRRLIETVLHRNLGQIDVTNSPFHFDGEEPHWAGPAPSVGEHNRDVLRRVLAMSDDDISGLEAEGVLFQP